MPLIQWHQYFMLWMFVRMHYLLLLLLIFWQISLGWPLCIHNDLSKLLCPHIFHSQVAISVSIQRRCAKHEDKNQNVFWGWEWSFQRAFCCSFVFYFFRKWSIFISNKNFDTQWTNKKKKTEIFSLFFLFKLSRKRYCMRLWCFFLLFNIECMCVFHCWAMIKKY